MTARRAAGLVLAAALLLLAPPARAQTDALSDVGQRTFAQVAGCAAGADHLLVAIVVDESSSLRQTDPGNRRVGAITTAVNALAGLPGAAAGKLDVEATLATFGSTYTQLVPWGGVEGAHADALTGAARTQLPGRDRADETDYRVALRGAQQSLQQRQAALGGTSCPVLLWFTDGELDVGAGTQAAAAELCDPQGLVDGLRGAHIPVIAVALFTDAGAGAVPPAAREQLRAIAEGTGDGTRCGAQPVPADAAPGAYLRADRPADLRRLFAGVAALLEGGRAAARTTCPGDACPGGALPVPLDRGVAGFRAVLETSAPPRLIAPDAGRHDLGAGSSTVLGAAVLVTTAEGLTTVSVTYPAGPPRSGVWTLETDGPAAVDVYYFWGVALGAAAPDGIVVGQPSRLEVTARFPDGTPVDPAAYQSLHLSLRAGGADVPLGTLAGGTASGEVTLPPGGPAAVPLSALATATSAPSGIALGPAAASATVTAALPPAFPRLDTPRLTFPTLSDTTAATGTLLLTGSDRGPTRACYAPGPLTGPAMAGRVAVTSDQRCLDLPAGAARAWDFHLRTGAPADGRVEGTLPLTLTAADGQATTTVAVPVTAGLVRPVNEPLRWGLTAALVLLALAVPCVIGWAGNAAVGRFAVGPRTRVASVPVVLTPGGPRRADDAPALFTADDFRYLPEPAPRRVTRLDAAGLRFSRTLPLVPFAEPAAWVRSASGKLVASTDPRQPWLDGRRARASFGLGSALYVALEPGAGEVRGRLVCVAEDSAGLGDLVEAGLAEVARSGAVWDEIHRRVTALCPAEPAVVAAGAGRAATGRGAAAAGRDAAGRDAAGRDAAGRDAGGRDADPQYRPLWDDADEPGGADAAPWDDGGQRWDEDSPWGGDAGPHRPDDHHHGHPPARDDDAPPSVFR
ncbi:vWA domain-containing protein [Georgenia ruanii]|uniref:vWA domain-containing protein n=1 Tax=Georgenia ruanii TaxID=348442 RepID=UPI00186ACC64|nr:VWA domain-containing protein [Georgenia ruanii]